MAIGTESVLLERQNELVELTGAIADAQRGGGRVVLVEAPAGLGKSSLLRAAGEAAAERGLECLSGPRH